MTHRARGNFLPFKEAPPWLQKAPAPREHPPSKRQKQRSKALPSALLPAHSSQRCCSLAFGGICSTVWSCIQTKLWKLLWRHFLPSSDQKEAKAVTCFLSAPGASSTMVSWGMLGVGLSCYTLAFHFISLNSCTTSCQQSSSAEEPCGDKHAPNLSTGTKERETMPKKAQATTT